MKVKEIEKEIDKRMKSIIHDLSTSITLYELYMNEASDKRKIKFEKKLEKKYRKAIEKIDKKQINFPGN